jgi:hypothetical protein
MRFGVLIVSIMLLTASLSAQKRYVVSSGGDVVPIKPGKSAMSEIMKSSRQAKIVNSQASCTPSRTFGNLRSEHNTAGSFVNFVHAHKDLIGIWFEAPTSGTIDSVFIQLGDYSLAGFPGHLTMRMHHSNLRTGHAPGWDPYIAPPRLCWGYFLNTADEDTANKGFGIAAFPDDATDTNWVNAYSLNNRGTAVQDHYYVLVDTTLPGFAPAAEEIWGSGGGLDIVAHNAAAASVDLADLGRPVVAKGYPFFISFRVPGNHPADPGSDPPFTDPTHMAVYGNGDGEGGSAGGHSDGNPDPVVRRNFHNWKFYEHPSFCGPGWLARGDDHLFIWYVMTATGDVAPTFVTVDQLGHTLQQTGSRTVQAELEDCNFTGGPTGVDSVRLLYTVDDGDEVVLPMEDIGGGTYQASIPAAACPNTVKYHLWSKDVAGNTSQSVSVTYRTLCMRTEIAVAETGVTRSYTSTLYSDPTASVIDTGKWFSPSRPGANHAEWDDGTAGPFPVGTVMFLGDTMHYAWVSTNGCMALSKTATDTVNVNYDGYGNVYELPRYTQLALPDTTTVSGVPRNFIAPFQADFIVADTTPATYGHVYYKNETDRFIVEWDSVANFNTAGTVVDEEIFRVVFNKVDGTIEYQYDNVGVNGIDSAALVGIQADSSNANEVHGFIMLNVNTYPYELKPRNNWAIKLYLAQKVSVADGWNMLSVAPTPAFGNFTKTSVFPDAVSQAFAYENGYKAQATLQNGPGYWMKYVGAQSAGVLGTLHTTQDLALAKGWNMIGSITSEIPATMTTDPTGQITGSYYEYASGYNPVSVITPGKAYWVKTNAAATLQFRIPSSAPKLPVMEDLSKLNMITLRGNGSQNLYLGDQSMVKGSYELPPAAPAGIFDARFASQNMVETYPSTMQSGVEYQYAINFQSSSYPVTVSWNIAKQPEGRTLVLTDGINGTIINNPMTGSGSIRITNASVKTLVVKLSEGLPAVPKAFALSQNYPNPFNPTTHMSVEMPKSADVEVAVYDILGQKIATLLNGQQGAGYHTVEWNGTNQAGLSVPSGTYFIRMISEDFTKVQKVMLMK